MGKEQYGTWKATHVFKSTSMSKLKWVALYFSATTKEARVVRLKSVAIAGQYTGVDTDEFRQVEARRPVRTFENLFLTEGDIHETVEIQHEELLPESTKDNEGKPILSLSSLVSELQRCSP